MRAPICYPLLGPLRILICFLSLISLIAIYIGKRLSTANESSDAVAPSGTILAKNSDKYFQDDTQLGLDYAIFFMALFIYFRPQTSYWWAAGPWRRMIVSWIMAGLGAGYAINQLVQILTTDDPAHSVDQIGNLPKGCSVHVYDLTRGRCYIQMGVSAAEMFWALLVVLEGGLWAMQRGDKVWHAQKANSEVQNAVLYQPTNTLPTADASDEEMDGSVELEEIRVEGGGLSSPTFQEDEPLPKYQVKAPKGQPRIIDATHPPERLREAVEERLHQDIPSGSSSSTASAPPASLVPSSSMPPSYSE
ncbi:hypothetical protein EMPS_01616 [Entomortierella parvispora]|uniref:Uncharacterized protein n=1 Tax=Entomortierella parvispora TaxID=205924 RepID=A0A9P3H354_9FUNG|nr:hypothetical protein EMPS_01616 [Entomortierella parvispora]